MRKKVRESPWWKVFWDNARDIWSGAAEQRHPYLMFSDMNKHFSSTIVCIHYMSGHWKLSLDFPKCFSNEKLNLQEWWYQGTLPLLSLVWETKFLNTPLWLYSLTISGCLGNFLCGHLEDSVRVGKFEACQLIHPPPRPFQQTLSAQQQSFVCVTWAKKLLYFDNILFYFTERLWYSRQLFKNWPNCDLLSYVTGKDWKERAEKYENKRTERSPRKIKTRESWRRLEHKWRPMEMQQGKT